MIKFQDAPITSFKLSQSDETQPKAPRVPKHISESVRAARLDAAQELLELADEEVNSYEQAYRSASSREYKTAMMAYLNLWKRVQKLAVGDVTKYGGAV